MNRHGLRPAIFIGLVIAVLRILEQLPGPISLAMLVLDVSWPLTGALLVFRAAEAAADSVRRGGGASACYGAGLVAASLMTAVVQLLLRLALTGRPQSVDSWALPGPYAFAFEALGVLVAGGIGMVVHHNHCVVRRILDNLHDVQLRQRRLEQGLLESRLAAARAENDPRELFDALARLRAAYASRPTEADAALDGLIEQLRARRASTTREHPA